MDEIASTSGDGPSPKRKRLSHACNYCRQKKTRCDEQQPSCRNCRLAGVVCITTDKRRSGMPVAHRRRAGTEVSPSLPEVSNPPRSRPSPAPPQAGQNRSRVWPQCWDKTGWKSGRLPMMPRFVGASMFDLMTEWLDLAFYRLKLPPPYTVSRSTDGRPEQSLSLGENAPSLPDAAEMHQYATQFLQGLHQIFPFLSTEQVHQICMEDQLDAPNQALKYLIVATTLIAPTSSEDSPSIVCSYIRFCNLLLGSIVATRCLESIQAILLFAIVLRSSDHIAWAWDILSLGVSMAQSIGVNQHRRTPEYGATRWEGHEYQTWWCIYVFEKILAFESGRPSMIWDRELSITPTGSSLEAAHTSSHQSYERACISLANILHEIQDRSARAWRREEWLPQTVDEAIEEKIQTSGELAELLADWQQSLPPEYQPRSSVASGFDNAPQSAFLSFYYYHAVIFLNRSTLLIEKTEFEDVIKRYASGKSWQHRISNGGIIGVETARDMIKLLVNLVDLKTPTYLTTMTSPIAAVYALAVHILRERNNSLLIRSDFELTKVGMEITKQYYRKHHTTINYDHTLSTLEEYLGQC